MKNKIIGILLTVMFIFLIGCTDEGNTDTRTLEQRRAEITVNNVYDKYWNKFDKLFTEYFERKQGEVYNAYLWSYFGGLGMQYHYVKSNPSDTVAKERYREMLDGLRYYRNISSTDELAKYNSGRGQYPNYGQGDIFFDDNIWVARNFIFAYDIFGQDEYLDLAKAVAAFVYTGWSEELSGIVWNERGLTNNATAQELERGLSANACGIIVSAELYRLTGEESYLVWANRFYDFCKIMQDPTTYIYYNGIHTVVSPNGDRSNGSVNTSLYSYNSGSMIIANLLMYGVTDDDKYLTDAKRSAEAAHLAYGMYDPTVDIYTYSGYIWFNAVLVDGYAMLYQYDKTAAEPYISAYKKAINYGYDNFRNSNGLIPGRYESGFITSEDGSDRQLLTQAGQAEIFALLSMCN